MLQLYFFSFANLCKKQGKYDRTESLFLEVIQTRKMKLGSQHPDTVSSILKALANMYKSQGKIAEVETLLLANSIVV